MRVDPCTHCIDVAEFHASPNYDDRPDGIAINLIVIHGISLPPGQFGGPWIDALFTNTLDTTAHPYFETLMGVRVSAHVLIRRDGQLVQYVPFHLRAWHAGLSSYNGRPRCNDFSIGIELEGTDDQLYDDRQYPPLATLITTLRATYPHIQSHHIVGHTDIAPGRKTDPGPAFDWIRLQRLLDGLIAT